MNKEFELSRKLLKWEDILKPGTPFWYISLYKENRKVKCPVCKGKGVLKLEGKEYNCPECHGWGEKTVIEPLEWHVGTMPGRDYCVVTRVEVEQVKDSDLYKVMYWDKCNGFAAEKCFTSKSTATKKCNLLNKKLREYENNLANT